jgi:hypothetical protein
MSDAMGGTLPLPGAEFQVNTITEGDQDHATVAMIENGSFAVCWKSSHNGNHIFARPFDSAGVPLTVQEIRVDDIPFPGQYPDISANKLGYFAIVWSYYEPTSDSFGIAGRTYEMGEGSFSPLTDPFAVSTNYSKGRALPDVAMEDNGDFWVIYDRIYGEGPNFLQHVYVRKFDVLGEPLVPEFRLSEKVSHFNEKTWTPAIPDICVNTNGAIAAAWCQTDLYINGAVRNRSVVGRAFIPPDLTPVVTIDPPALGNVEYEGRPMVALRASNDLVISWTQYIGLTPKVFAKKLTNFTAWERRIAFSGTTRQRRSVPLISDYQEDFVVLWDETDPHTGTWDVYLQVFDSSATPQPHRYRVHEANAANQKRPAVAMRSDPAANPIIITWESDDIDGKDIFGKLAIVPDAE